MPRRPPASPRTPKSPRAKKTASSPSAPPAASPTALEAATAPVDDGGPLAPGAEDTPPPREEPSVPPEPVVRVRRLHRRDLNKVWEFLKLTFRDVNRETVEYQRPRTKQRFLEVYEEDGIEQLLFEIDGGTEIVGYAECAFEPAGSDSWINVRYFENRDMRPLFVEELAVHPRFQGTGVGSFVLEQVEHLARVRGCTHLVLEVAENNDRAHRFYKKRSFYKLDAAIFLAKKVISEEELLPPRRLRPPGPRPG